MLDMRKSVRISLINERGKKSNICYLLTVDFGFSFCHEISNQATMDHILNNNQNLEGSKEKYNSKSHKFYRTGTTLGGQEDYKNSNRCEENKKGRKETS